MFLPRSQIPRWHYLLGPAYLILFFWLSSYITDSVREYFIPLLLVYQGALVALLWFGKLRSFIWERRALVDFRSLSREEQQAYLRSVWPSGLRAEYLRLVDMEETYIVDGRDAYYPFPEAERRLHRWLLLAVVLFVILMLSLWFLFPGWPPSIRVVPAALAFIAAVPAAWLLGRLSLLETRLHVSPFAVEITGPALPRRLSLNQPLRLTNYPAKGFFALEAPLTGQRLRIHHARIGALHAYRLIWENGQFEPPPEPDAVT
jgi:hypothetical protein